MRETSHIKNRNNISADLADTLRELIVNGALRPGERINEARLAESLGVSRTPLRESLMTLCAEGAAQAIPRRGFFVRELT
ncbi:MAG TPA: GntR family transcriptional regulator, partial [candidate division Zixibacteria bacterium]|nr:GntR family transcriptional regulator [candidate division Zixibacteria bacterium]